MTFQARQGDIFLRGCASVTGTPIVRDNGRIVLAYGETTGHAHAIAEKSVEFVLTDDGRRILISSVPFTLTHEEHGPITVPAGAYEVVRQRKYHPVAIRTVAD